MNLTNPLHTYFVLISLVCILNGTYGTRIPLEIVQLESGNRLNADKIANTEYQVHEVDDPAYLTNKHHPKNVTKNDDWFSRMFNLNHKTTSARDAQEPRIFYQIGVSILELLDFDSSFDFHLIQYRVMQRNEEFPPFNKIICFLSS